MSTLEYELGKHPGPPERERVDVDPITLRVNPWVKSRNVSVP